jgi:hypothetical protein
MRWRLLTLAVACAPLAAPQGANLPSSGVLTYRVEWRLITGGRARVEWSAVEQPQPGWQAKVRLESVGLVSKLYKVQDDYLASLDRGMCAVAVQTTSNEGSRQRDAKITFDYRSKKASYLEHDRVKNAVLAADEIDIPSCVHDVLGGMFFLRTLNLEPGQSANVPVSDGKKAVVARVQAQQREDLKVPDGAYKTIRYEAFLFDNVLYRRSAHLYVWLSDDQRKLPVQIQVRMPITVGTITLELEKHE